MASSTSSRLIWPCAVLLVGLVVCLAYYVLTLLFNESLYSQRGSFAFFVTIQEPVIRNFPVLDASSEPQYHSGCGDGPKQPDEAISYRSRLSVAELVARVQPHIVSHGFVPGNDDSFPGACFVNGKETLFLNVTKADDGATLLDCKVLLGLE